MGRSFKELGRKAEQLMEQGRQADEKLSQAQARVSLATSKLSQAQSRLERAMEKDEEGRYLGDVDAARLDFQMAQNQLEASRRVYQQASDEMAAVRSEKNSHVHEISSYTNAERKNLDTLKRLDGFEFSAASADMRMGMSKRVREANQLRKMLLESMGIRDSSSEKIEGALSSSASSFMGEETLDFTNLDSVQLASKVRMKQIQDDIYDVFHDESISREDQYQAFVDVYKKHYEKDVNLINAQKIAYLQERANTLPMDSSDRHFYGENYISSAKQVYESELRNVNIFSEEEIKVRLADYELSMLESLSDDLEEDGVSLYDPAKVDFKNRVVSDARQNVDTAYKRQEASELRQKLQIGLVNGSVGEKDIRHYGSFVANDYYNRIYQYSEKKEDIRIKQNDLAYQYMQAMGKSETREKIEIQRKLLLRQENLLEGTFDRKKVLKDVLSEYRELGYRDGISTQQYLSSGSINVGKEKRLIECDAKAIAVMRETCDYLPRDWIEPLASKKLLVSHNNRGFCLVQDDFDTIVLSGENKEAMMRCGFHELGHRFEMSNSNILKAEREFYDRRTAGEALERLSDITGNPGYGESELARRDHFIDSYMGKDYDGEAYELMSMGLEGIFSGSKYIEEDEEFRELIFGSLAYL